MKIIPAILVDNYQELSKQLNKVAPLFDYVQLDIMDGNFVTNRSFNYNENVNLADYFNGELINGLLTTGLKYELHLMVKNPLQEIPRWKDIKNIFRVIFHIESEDNPDEVIKAIKTNGWQVGVAINPDTPIEKITPYTDKVNLVLFMTVHPGRQGAPFVKQVKDKVIKLATMLSHPIVAVDGGINQNTIKEAMSWGVDIFNVGSALMLNNDIEKALKVLNYSLVISNLTSN